MVRELGARILGLRLATVPALRSDRRRVTHEPDDDLVPVSVRLGEVVPPEDPEDWTRPLTWVAAFGMLAGPIVALAWFLVAPPEDAAARSPRPTSWPPSWRPARPRPAPPSSGAARACTPRSAPASSARSSSSSSAS